jgi:Na+/melibiose symporter-like transporter
MDKTNFFGYNRRLMGTALAAGKNSTLKNMFLLGTAWFGMSAFFAFNTASVPLFFNERIEQKWVVGLILGMMGAFGVFVSPISGILSDKMRHRLGRRRPLMILGLPFVLLLMVFTQYLPSPALMALIWPFVYFFHLLIERPYSALLPDIISTDKRATANGVCQFMGGGGNLLYFVVGGYLWARSEEATFYLVALVYGLGISLVLLGISERPTHLDEVKINSSSSFFSYVKELAGRKTLINYSLASLFWQIGLNSVMPWMTSFGTKELGMSVTLSFMILAMSVGVLIILAVPVGMLADKAGRTRLMSFGLLIFVIINFLVVFVHSIPLMFVLMAIVSFGFCIVMVVPFAILVSLIPENRMAELIGVASIPIYLSIFIGPLLSGLLIDIFGSYRPIFVLAAISHSIGFLLLQRVKEEAPVLQAA